jgi:sugar phosphate isomerase/epimerase
VGNWTERVQDAVRVARKVDRKNFGVTFNLCHCLAVGDEDKIPALLEEAAPHLFMVSINGADSKAPGGGWGRLIQALDQGTFDMVPLLKKLQAINYRGPIGLQGYGVKGDAKDNLARSMAAWRQLSARAMQ